VDTPPATTEDVLAVPVRARLFSALSELRRPATTQELAELVGRHPNTVRLQLESLAEHGLLERRTVAQQRGRPRHHWAIAADARPGGSDPEAYVQLGTWLARALARPRGLEEIERTGREIGRELAPEPGRPVADAMHDALAALGFSPRRERAGSEHLRFVLRNCPYRDAVRENQPAVCALHRGITAGLLEHLSPDARLAGFVPKDPDTAGCVVEVSRRRRAPS
jgi:predicted ArsR family transcriptional regulator